MKHIGALLRLYIERSGYTIYGAAKKSGVNRTTLQKILSEDRLPSWQTLNKLIPILKLSPEESEKLFSAMEIREIGEAAYMKREYIQQLLSRAFSLNGTFLMARSECEPRTKHPDPMPDFIRPNQLIRGELSVLLALDYLLKQECTYPESVIRFNFPGLPENIGRHILEYILKYHPSQKVKIQHLTTFSKTADTADDSLTNLSHLSGILPFLATAQNNYQVYYLYGNSVHANSIQNHTAFPYYIIFSDMMLLLSEDCKTALPCTDEGTIRFFINHFDRLKREGIPLITSCPQSESLLSHLLQADQISMEADHDCASFCLQYYPCLSIFLPKDLLRQYMVPGLPGEDLLMEQAGQRFDQVRSLKKHVCFFSREGMEDFVKTGRLADIPQSCMYPLSAQHRILILEQLAQEIAQGRQTYLMINQELFPLSSNLSCALHGTYALDFLVLDCHESNHQYLYIQEPAIVEAFYDFFSWFAHSRMVCPKEETLTLIQECIDRLQPVP